MFALILTCLTHPVLGSLFICIHLLVICSCSVDELVFLVYNWMTKSKKESSTSVLSICSPYPMAMCAELFISHSWCGYFTLPKTYVMLKLRTFTSCQGTCTYPQIIIFFLFFFWKINYPFFKLYDLFQLNWKMSPKFFFNTEIGTWWREVVQFRRESSANKLIFFFFWAMETTILLFKHGVKWSELWFRNINLTTVFLMA